VRSRRNADRRFYALAASAGALALGLWGRAVRRPVDTFAVLAALAASLIIIVNAVFLQSGSHPVPFFATPKPTQVAVDVPPRPVAPAHPEAATSLPQPVAVRRDDPIAELIEPSAHVAAVQRALSEYGYGQIKPSGMLDDATSTAIEKFERDHKLPVTGRITDRLVNDLTAMVGHPLD
jgi:Putative peptidoglycan binding domain